MMEYDLPKQAAWVFISAIGGVVKIGLGGEKLEVSMWVVMLVSISTGYLAAQYTDTTEYQEAAYIVAYFASIAALNLARGMSSKGFASLLERFVGTK